MKTLTFQSLAADMDRALYYDESCERFLLRDGSPAWMHDIISKTSSNTASTSWEYLYKFANRIVSAFASGDDPENAISELEPDMYTSEPLAWVGASVYHMYYIDDVLEEGSVIDAFGLFACAQKRHIEDLAHTILNALKDLLETLKDERSDLLLDNAFVRVNGVPRFAVDYNVDDDEILVTSAVANDNNEYDNDGGDNSEWLSPEDVILHDPEADYWPECDDNVYAMPGAPEYV